MTPIDHINQQAVATYVREAIWPGNKSFQRVGVSGGMIKKFVSDDTKKGCITSGCGWKKTYWETMILGITIDKFCSLSANFMQELFEQFQGKFYSI